MAISDIRRIAPDSVDPTVKNYHWLDLVMGLYEAYERDAETVILTDRNGNLAEGPGFNVFAVKDGQIATPAVGVLQGVTRQSVIELAAEQQIAVSLRPVTPAEGRNAEEMFASSTAGGIMPITRVDGMPVAKGKMGPITQSLIEAYWLKHTDDSWSIAVRDIVSDGETL